MGAVIGDILPLAVGVALPIPIIAVILMLFSKNARSTSLGFLAGWFLGVTVVATVVVFIASPTQQATSAAHLSPMPAFVRILLGVLLLSAAYRNWKKRPRPGEQVEMPKWMSSIDSMTAGRALGLGALLSGVNPKNLALILAAGVAIAAAGLTTSQTIISLIIFILLACVSVAVPVIVYLVMGARAEPMLNSWKAWLAQNNATVMMILMLVFGVVTLSPGARRRARSPHRYALHASSRACEGGREQEARAMLTILVRRVVRLCVVLAGVSLVTFAILHVSGDPISLLMPEAPEADRAVLGRSMGLEDPLPIQFVRFLASTATGNFGQSFFHKVPALGLVLERMPTTLLLTVLAMGLALAVAVPAGILSAVRRNSLFDHAATITVFLGQSMPVFWTGIMLMLLYAVQWRLLPVSGWDSWASLVLPAITLGSFSAPLLLRIVRSSMLEVINLDYVRTARAKGLTEWFVICRHALVNAVLPLVTVAGLQFGLLLGGAVITETVFAVPGVGRLIVGAIRQLDFPIVQAGVFILALIVVLVNFAVDLLYIYLNPQIRVR